jgi:acetyl-CoA C-acetyltransferase
MNNPVIVSTSRSPIGRAFKGSLAAVRPDDLLSFYLADVLSKTKGLSIDEVDDIIVGCGLPGGEQGFNIARVAAVLNGWNNVSATTVNRYCASSLQAITQAASHIVAGYGDTYIAGGVECASRFIFGSSDTIENTTNPKFDDAMNRSSSALTPGTPAWNEQPGLPDVYIAMGLTAENVADVYGVTREQMDEFALESQQRCEAAQARGFFADEITPYTLDDSTVVSADDSPRAGTTLEALQGLKPAFRDDGRVTAGNACPLNDGAAAVVVMSEAKANSLGLQPLARIVGAATTGLNPEIMGVGPIEAVKKVLAQTSLTIDDIDLVELNEAFAAQVIPCAQELGIDREKLNVNGGAIALGHPFGMTGARIMTTLIHGLQDTGGRYGLETMCVGGGQGMAVVIERL